MRLKITLAILCLFVTISVAAEPDCPCFPNETTWVVTPCETWNCAMSAVLVANGNPDVLAFATSSEQYRWVVLRRVGAGSVTTSPDNPFDSELFTAFADGAARMAAIDSLRKPMILSMPDGRTLLVSLKQPERRRAAGR